MNTIVPIFIPSSSSEPVPDPKCPHCNKTLKGWSEPSEESFFPILVIAKVIGIIFLVQIMGVITGAMEGSFERCERPFSKRYHYILPVYPYSCVAIRWLNNKENFFVEER